MATQTRTGRQAAGSKAAATRKRNAANRSTTRTKASATHTKNEARSTARAAQSTARQATDTVEHHAEAATSRLQALARRAERTLVLIPVGAALEARDATVSQLRTYADRDTAKRELDRFEQRGERALGRN